MRRDISFSITGLILFAVALTGSAASGETRTLVVLTSYPRLFYEPIVAAFEARNPDVSVSIVNRNTMSLIRMAERERRPKPDVVWMTSPVGFEMLRRANVLAVVPELERPSFRKGALPLDSSDATRFGFTRFELGISFDHDETRQDGFNPERSVSFLAAARFHGKLGMSSPARSGTTHLFVECILQRYGWKDGWALISRIGGNLATVTARSFGVRDGVLNERFPYGITVDFLALPPQEKTEALTFARLVSCPEFPASLAITVQSREHDAALAFVEFLRSPDAQRLVAPYGMNTRTSGGAASPRGGGGPTSFDVALAADRLGVVTILFTQMVEKRRDELAVLWDRIHDLERAAPQERDAGERRRLEEARHLVTSVPVTDYMARAPELALALDVSKEQLPFVEGVSRIEQSWSDDFDGRYRRASALLDEVENADRPKSDAGRR